MKKNYLFKRLIIIGLIVFFGPEWVLGQVPNAWINEIHYDNVGGDVNEAIEVIVENPGSWNLSLLVVNLYNGNGGAVYDTETLSSFLIGSTSGNFSIYSKLISDPQNGPDGMSLSYNGTLIQFLSYEGTFTATDGPAIDITSTDIGVAETTTASVGTSLQLSGTGLQYSDFTWQPSATATLGSLSAGQVLATPPTPPTITVSPTTLTNLSYIEGEGPSSEQSFNVEGSNLTANISIAPPANYEISTLTGGSFLATNPITLTQTGGKVSSTTIYTRLKAGLSVGDYNAEDISATSTNAATKSVTCSGAVHKSEPTNHVTGFTATANGSSIINLVWAENDGTVIPDGYIIMANTGAITAPADGTDPSDDTDLTDDSGNIKVTHGVTSYSFNNCSPVTTYNIEIYPYTNSGTAINFKTDATVPADDATTGAAAAEPVIGDLIITEVSGDGSNGTSDDGFIEIYNSSAIELSLANVSARYYNSNPGSATKTVPLSGSIAAGEFKIVTQNGTNFQTEYGIAADFTGSTFYFNGTDDGMDIYHTTLGILDQFNDNGVGASSWFWEDASVWERTNNGSGAIQSNWTEYESGTGTPKALLLISWEGNTDDTWNTLGHWDKIIPGYYQNVNIPTGKTPIISSTTSANCKNLTLEGTATLNILSDASNSGSLIFGGTYTGLGAVTYNRHLIGNKWHMLGSPLSGQSITSAFLTANSIIGMKDYIEGPTEEWSTDYITTAPNVDFDLGQGYVTKNSSDGVISLTGTPNNAEVNFSITRNANGWNLLSNPFTSAIAANENGDVSNNLLAVNADNLDPLFASIYVWEEGDSYDGNTNFYKAISNSGSTVTPAGQNYLQVGQGFFVRSKTGGGSFSITPDMQSHQTATVFKSDISDWKSITLLAESNNAKASTLISYNEGMTIGLDVTYDAGLLNSYPAFALYTRFIEDNGVDFMIQALPEDFENIIVPVGLDATAGEIISFSANSISLPEEYTVVLEDRTLNVFTDLSDVNAKYTHQLTNDIDGIGRFYIHTVIQSALSLGDPNTQDPFQVFTRASDNQIVIRGAADSNTTARIYSITGKQVATVNLNLTTENHIRFTEEAGVYIVQITNEQGTSTQKFVWVK